MKAMNALRCGQTSISLGHRCTRFDVNQPSTAAVSGSLARLLHAYLAPSSHSFSAAGKEGFLGKAGLSAN